MARNGIDKTGVTECKLKFYTITDGDGAIDRLVINNAGLAYPPHLIINWHLP